MSNQADFLQRLEAEAARQAMLQHHRLLPAQLDFITAMIGRYTWQTCAILAGFTAIFLQVVPL